MKMKRFMSLILSACMLFGLASTLPAGVFEDSTIACFAQAKDDETFLPVGDARPIPIFDANEPAFADSSDISMPFSDMEYFKNSLIRETSSTYIRSCLTRYPNGEKMLKFYDDIVDKLESLWYKSETLGSSIRWFNSYSYGLTLDEALMTATMMLEANPMMFFVYKGIWRGSYGIGFEVLDDYLEPSDREAWNTKVKNYIDSYKTVLDGKTTLYQKALTIHDELINRINYAFVPGTRTPVSDSWAHNITGAIDNLSAVCEGYSKTYQLLVNYYGGDCSYSHGGGHAWNIVKLDDNKYYFVDTTWDDPVSNYGDILRHTYFAVGTTSFLRDHTIQDGYDSTEIPSVPYNYHYIIPDIPNEDFDPEFGPHIHTYTAANVVSATCTAKGYTLYTCDCGDSKRDNYTDALGHDYKDTVVAPTCTAKGYTLHKCSRCSDSYKDNYTDPTGHSFGDWRVTTDPTCTAKGVETRKCKNCEATENRDIDPLGHKWGDWRTTKEATTTTEGKKERTCSVCKKTETQTIPIKSTSEITITRLAGSGRYETAAKISQAAFDKADTVVLANGLNYADALAGVSFATKLKAPILLTNTKSLDPTTLAEIKRLKAKNVIILGGTGAISTAVENSLKKEGLKTERIAGASRFGTATAIAEKLTDAPTDVFFVYAFNSADALSVSPIAACKNAPIIYLSTKGDLNADTAAYLAKLKKAGCVKNAYVIGGEGVISNDMMNKAAKALGLKTATRIAGNNRFGTCVAVNEAFSDILDGDTICVATGMNFPDALAGGVYAALNKAPLFLINGGQRTPKLSDEQKAYLKSKAAGKITAFGGTGVVPDSHIADIAKNSI